MKWLLKNIPNLLSGWRLLTFPVLLYFIFTGKRDAFILLLSVNLITDILDGLIARLFRLQTNFGARLDSMADMGTYIAAFTAFVVLEWTFVSEHAVAFSVLMVMWVVPQLVAVIRFGRPPHFHLWSNKIAGYVQGIFIFTYFNWGTTDAFFLTMCSISLLAFSEELLVAIRIPRLRSDVKGIYWMMKENGRII